MDYETLVSYPYLRCHPELVSGSLVTLKSEIPNQVRNDKLFAGQDTIYQAASVFENILYAGKEFLRVDLFLFRGKFLEPVDSLD